MTPCDVAQASGQEKHSNHFRRASMSHMYCAIYAVQIILAMPAARLFHPDKPKFGRRSLLPLPARSGCLVQLRERRPNTHAWTHQTADEKMIDVEFQLRLLFSASSTPYVNSKASTCLSESCP